MRCLKVTLVILVMLSQSLSLCFANDTTKFNIMSTKEIVYVDKLYLTDGEGEYKGYRKLNGYPKQNKFQVYYQNGIVTYKDLRGIDLNEIITWNNEGKLMKSTRRTLYGIFEDAAKLHRDPLYEGKLSTKWLSKTFGQVYSDWYDGLIYMQDAQTLVFRFTEYQNKDNSFNRYELSDIKIINE